MKLFTLILSLYICCDCQGFLNSTTEVAPTNLSATADVNVTRPEEVNNHPYIKPLSGKCNWTLSMPKNSSLDVPLEGESADALVREICQGLDCGGVYDMKTTKTASNSSCFFGCFYKEGHLQNCSQGPAGDCVVISEAVCGAHMVRLSGASDRCEGRVEVWRGGQWGTVCDDQWDLQDADVVCRQLGCGYALTVSGQEGLFPPGRGPAPVLLDDLNCTSTEPHLWACPASEEPDCGHKEDAGVVCSEMRAVRLSGGEDRCSGTVEVHHNGSWGTVCDNCWNKDMAAMVCSMLQCGNETEKFTQFLPPLNHNNGPRYYYNCGPKAQNLWECEEYNIDFMCFESSASGVICKGSLGFLTPTTAKVVTRLTPTTWITESTTVKPFGALSLWDLLLLMFAVSLALLVFLIINTVLCWHFRKRNKFLVQSHKSPSKISKQLGNNYEDSVDLTKVTTNPEHEDVPFLPKHLWTHSSVDSTSVDTDYEPFDPSVALSTFRNSQRYKTDRNPLMTPSGLVSLKEDASEPVHGVVGAFMSYNGADNNRASRYSEDSFETSSTSSEETYKNTNTVPTSEAEGPVYSAVSPESDTSSGEDYDNVAS